MALLWRLEIFLFFPPTSTGPLCLDTFCSLHELLLYSRFLGYWIVSGSFPWESSHLIDGTALRPCVPLRNTKPHCENDAYIYKTTFAF